MTGLDQALGNILQMYEQSPSLLLATLGLIAATIIIIRYIDKIQAISGAVDEAEPSEVAREYFRNELKTEGEKVDLPLYKRTDTNLNKLGFVRYETVDEVPDYRVSPIPLIATNPHKSGGAAFNKDQEDEETSYEKVKMLGVDNENQSFLDRVIDKLMRRDNSVYYSLKPGNFEDDAVNKLVIKKDVVLDSTYGIKHDRSLEANNTVNKGIRTGFAEELTKNQFNLPRYVNHGNQQHSMRNENIETGKSEEADEL